MSSSSSSSLPQPSLLQQRCERIGTKHQAFFRQLLASQRRAKVGVAFLMSLDDPLPQVLAHAMIAGPASQPVQQSFIGLLLETLPDSPGLTYRQAHQLCRGNDTQLTTFDPAQRIQTNPLFQRHSKFTHPAGLTQLRGDTSI